MLNPVSFCFTILVAAILSAAAARLPQWLSRYSEARLRTLNRVLDGLLAIAVLLLVFDH